MNHASYSLEDLLLEVQQDLSSSVVASTSTERRRLPRVTLSYAQTLDASIAPEDRSRMSISSPSSFALLHSLRGIHDAVLIGGNTLLYDNPRLNVRSPLPGLKRLLQRTGRSREPRPVVIDTELRNVLQCNLEHTAIRQPIVITALHPSDSIYQQVEKLIQEKLDGVLISCRRDERSGKCDLKACLECLRERFDIQSVLLEGGATMIHSFLAEGLVDQCVITLQCAFLGGYRALPSSLPHLVSLQTSSVKVARSDEGDVLIYGQVDHHHQQQPQQD